MVVIEQSMVQFIARRQLCLALKPTSLCTYNSPFLSSQLCTHLFSVARPTIYTWYLATSLKCNNWYLSTAERQHETLES